MPDITVQVPGEIYKYYLHEARKHKRSIEEEARETILKHTALRRATRRGRLRANAHLINRRREFTPLEL
jgi:acyl CoA:acetate/3-ketoacid CoA transferase